MKNPINMLVILAGPGFGKTSLCSALTEWILTTFESCRYHKDDILLTQLRRVVSEGAGDYNEALRWKTDDDLVILDDVGNWANREHATQKDNNWKIEVFFSFLESRYNTMRPTIITSNLDKEQFLKVYSERVTSRLFASENTIISIGPDDYVDQRTLGK